MISLACQTCPKAIQLQGLFNSLHTAVIHYNEDGHLAGANDVAKSILPVAGEDLALAENFIRYVYDHSIDSSHHDSWLSSLRGEPHEQIFYEVIEAQNGKSYLVRAVSHADKSMVVELSDITMIKTHADQLVYLSESHQILIEAIQSSPDGLFIAENRGENRIIFANRVVQDHLGMLHIPLVGYSVEALLSSQFPMDWEAIQSVICQCGEGKFWKHIPVQGQDGTWLSLRLSASRRCGDLQLIIGTLSDETQSKVQETHLRQTQKLEAIGKLAGGVAHDFNNILSIVEGYIRLSEAALKRGEDVRANFNRIKQAVARGSGLTKQLLMFGKHRVSEQRVIDLAYQVREMEHFLQPLLGAQIRLCMDVGHGEVPVLTSADNVSQIIMNLVLNARDAMPDGGDIIVSLYPEGDRATLKVIDSGTGMPPAVLEKIFDPFFTTKEQGKGTGLGLSMVYGLVQQMNGQMDVSSVVGEGTSFTISVPLMDKKDMSPEDRAPRMGDGVLRGRTVLVAEDETDLLNIMEATLGEFEMKVLKAKDGNEALQIQDEYEGKIDFLLTDMVMPELGGLKLAELMREVRPETQILFMSGYPVRGEISDIDLPEEAMFMAKPVQPDFLKSVLEQMVSGHSVDKASATLWQS